MVIAGNKKFNIISIITVLAAASLAVFAGCGDNNSSAQVSSSASASSQEESRIISLIDSNRSGIFGFEDYLESESAIDENGNASKESDAQAPHQRWFRHYTDIDENKTVGIDGNTALVTITGRWTGKFGVKPQTGSSLVEKDIDDTVTSQARFEKENGNWVLKAVSPLVIEPTSQEQSASIKSVKFTVNGTPVLTVTDPSKLINLEDFPKAARNSTVRVEVETQFSGTSTFTPPLYTFVHYGRRGLEGHSREAASLEDQSGGIYSVTYRTGSGSALWKRGAVDVLNAACIQNDENNYQSNVWVIPYRVNTE